MYDETSSCPDCGTTYLTTQGHNCAGSPPPLELWTCPLGHEKYVPVPEGWPANVAPLCRVCGRAMVLRSYPGGAEGEALLAITAPAPLPAPVELPPAVTVRSPHRPWYRRLLPWGRSRGSTAPRDRDGR